jgi:hypothetical protein
MNTILTTKCVAPLRFLRAAFLFIGFALAPAVFGQGLTSAEITGTVSDAQGKPLAGTTVTALHEPSGTVATTTTRANGQYNLSNLRVGGPYTVTAKAPGLALQPAKGIFIEPGDSTTRNFGLNSDVVQLEKFTVGADRDTTFGNGKMGTGTNLTDEEIANNIASVRRNVQDLAVTDSRLALMSLDQGGQLSAQGQNFRFNSFTVDGVQAADPFGLNSNGFSSLRSPIPLDAIQSFSVDLAPYDVRRAGATGAYLNAVIKSGTNNFHGSAYYEYTNQDWRDKNPVTFLKETFKERTFGATVGGPIIKDKLFFFIAYEDFRREAAPPQANFIPNATDLAAVVARAKGLGYDTGDLSANNLASQKSTIGKIDWNISANHRLTVTYRRVYGQDVAFPSYTGSTTTSLSNYWYAQPRNTDSYTAQLFSQWTPDFRTEVDLSYTKYDGSPQNNGKPFPQVQVQSIGGTRLDTGATITNGAIFFGTESSRQLNAITSKETNGKVSGEYSLGDHNLTFGVEDISTKYVNAFIQYTDGYYTFANIANWIAGTPPSAFQLAKPYPGFTVNDAVARWRYDAYAGFIQDSWHPNSQLTLLAGVRYDYPYVPQKPPAAGGFAAAGFTTDSGRAVTANDTTNSGNGTAAPRVGFTYQFKTERKTQLRGGVGLFQGKNPAVWLSNAYSNAGSVANVTATSAQLPGIAFSSDVNNQPVPSGTLSAPNINITDPDFKQPAIWKANVALDHRLPFLDATLTVEGYYTKNYKMPNTLFLNYLLSTAANGATTMPDGRQHYNGTITSGTSTSVNGRRRVTTGGPVGTGFADVLYLTNTDKGYSNGLTLGLKRAMKNHWAWGFDWTRAHATEVSPITSSTASSNYSNRAVFDPNEDIASTSNTNIRDRFVVTLAREFDFLKMKDTKTTIAAIYQSRTGHPYSWVFRGDANGDGYAFNDLLYIPTGPTDSKVAWAVTSERDAFFAFADANGLMKYAGSHAPRNSQTSPWTQNLDIKLTQQIPLFRSLRAELFANFLNFGGLIHKGWGQLEEVPFSYRRAVAGATLNPTANGGAGQWNYTFNGGTLDGVPVVANDTPVSRWQIQMGMRLKF